MTDRIERSGARAPAHLRRSLTRTLLAGMGVAGLPGCAQILGIEETPVADGVGVTSTGGMAGMSGNGGAPGRGDTGGGDTGGQNTGAQDSGGTTTGGTGGSETDGLEFVTDELALPFNRDFSIEVEVRGGKGDVTFTLGDDAELPPGVLLNADGQLVGRAIEPGVYDVEIVVTDEMDQVATQLVTLRIERTKRWLAYVADHEEFEKDELYIYDLLNPTQKAKRVVIENLDDVFGFEFSPDGQKIACVAVVAGVKQLYVVDPATADATLISKEVPVWGTGRFLMGWSPDSTKLLFSGRVTDAPELYLADPSLESPADPTILFDFPIEPALSAFWAGSERAIVGSDKHLYWIDLPSDGSPSEPQELLIPNEAELGSPPSFKQPALEPRVLFFHLVDGFGSTVYLIDSRTSTTSITQLAYVAGDVWAPSPDGLWLAHLEQGESLESVGPIVRSIDAPGDPWKRQGYQNFVWTNRGSTLFWMGDQASPFSLNKTDFADGMQTIERPIQEPLEIRAVSSDETHLLLSDTQQIQLWDGSDVQLLLNEQTIDESFAPHGVAYAYRELDSTLHLGRVGNNAKSTTWTPAGEHKVEAYAWSADAAALVYRAKYGSNGSQLYRTDVLQGKASGQSVHPLVECITPVTECPTVKMFALQP